MRPIDQQTILITGATDGLGRALAARLAAEGATVLVHGRDDQRGKATLQEIGGRASWYRADLSSLAETRALAEAVRADHPRLDVLVNNAGIGGPDSWQASADGHELTFAVNYLSGYLLTRLLLRLRRRHAHPPLPELRGVLPEQARPGPVHHRPRRRAGRDGRHRERPAPGHVHADQDGPVAGQHAGGGRGGDASPRRRSGTGRRLRPLLRRARARLRALSDDLTSP